MKSRTLNPNAGEKAKPPSQAGRLAVPLPLTTFSNIHSENPTASPDQPTEASKPQIEETGKDRTILIDVDLIDPHPTPPRTVYSVEILLERAESLRSAGQINPIHVMPNPDAPGRYIIIDGWTRVQACHMHRALPALNAEVHQGLSLTEAAWMGWQSNEGREQHCDYDRAMFFEKLISQGSLAIDIARQAGLSRGVMSMYLSYAKLPGEVKAVISEHPHKFGHRAAYELSRIFDATEKNIKKTLAIALKFAAEDHTVRWLIMEAQSFVTPNKSKPSNTNGNKKVIRYANGSYKQTDEEFFMSMKVAPEKRDFFAAAMEKLLDEVAVRSTQPDPASVDIQLRADVASTEK